MSCTREQLVAQAKSWLGCNEADGSFQKIIDIYNSHKPLARGYELKYTDEWCAGFASACAIACGATDIIPTEVSCFYLVELFKKMGIWVEADDYVPKPGDYIVYYWKDDGKGDCTEGASHVGIVVISNGNTFVVIEGNKGETVSRRYLTVNDIYIRGFGVPRYDAETVPDTAPKPYTLELPQLYKGCKGELVEAVQAILIHRGYSCGASGVDGSFGPATDKAVRAFQSDCELDPDGYVGRNTMRALLGL